MQKAIMFLDKVFMDEEKSDEDLNLNSFGIGIVLILAITFFGLVS